MHILFLSSWFPYPPDNGSKIRIYNLLKGLAGRHRVTLLAFYREPGVEQHLPVLQAMCHRVEVSPWREFNPRRLTALVGLASRRPRSIVDTFSPAMQALIERQVAGNERYDVVVCSELPAATYRESFAHLPALLDDVELAAIYDRYADATSPWHRLRSGLTWLKTSRYVGRLVRRFRACTVVSEREREILASIAPGYGPVAVIPNCLDFGEYRAVRGEPRPATLIFAGSITYSANYEAVCFFLAEVYPWIREKVPEVTFYVTGRTDGRRLPEGLPNAGVHVTGYVDDVRPLMASSWVSVVPLRAGGGTRLKILESLALGTPVVSTSKGAEGLAVEHGQHLLIADTPREFADAVVRLLKDPALRARLGERGRRLAEERYNWERVLPMFLDLVEECAR